MSKKDSRHLIDRLAEIQDPRKEKGKRHPLNSTLALNIVGFMCGHKRYTSIAIWTRSQPELVQALGFTQKETIKVHYGITSLKPEEASVERLLRLRRGHWSIENKSHWIRDNTLGEDTSSVRCGAIPQIMAALRNAALAVLRFAGVERIADEIKYLASKPKLLVNYITDVF